MSLQVRPTWMHIPALFIATTFTVFGVTPLKDPEGSMRRYGFPETLIAFRPTHPVYQVSGSRSTAIGLAMFAFYLKGQLGAMDTVMASTIWCGVVDWLVLRAQGDPSRAWVRFAWHTIFGLWGLCGLTSYTF